MFNAEEVLMALIGRVGWRNNSPLQLTDENKESRSKRYFQDFHRVVTLANIRDNADIEFSNETQFNDLLIQLQESAIMNSLSGLFNEDILIEQSFIFNRDSKRKTFQQSNSGKKTGYKISLAKDSSYCSVIKSISLLFAESGTVKVILEHNNIGKIHEEEIDVTAGVENIVDMDEVLSYSSGKYKGGYFLLYFETDLKPIEFNYSCFNKTFLFSAIPFEATDLNNISETSKTYGMNVEICSYRDFTDIIKKNQSVFDNLIGLQMACNVIELILNSTRSNKTERITKEQTQALYNDLNIAYSTPEFPFTTGIRNQIAREVKRLKQNFFPKDKSFTTTPCFTK